MKKRTFSKKPLSRRRNTRKPRKMGIKKTRKLIKKTVNQMSESKYRQ